MDYRNSRNYMKRFKIKDEVYNTVIYISLGGELKSFEKYLMKQTKCKMNIEPGTTDQDLFEALTYYNGRMIGIWFKHVKPHVSTVAHESLHATYHILNSCGMKLNTESEEAFAYHLGWLVENIVKELR